MTRPGTAAPAASLCLAAAPLAAAPFACASAAAAGPPACSAAGPSPASTSEAGATTESVQGSKDVSVDLLSGSVQGCRRRGALPRQARRCQGRIRGSEASTVCPPPNSLPDSASLLAVNAPLAELPDAADAVHGPFSNGQAAVKRCDQKLQVESVEETKGADDQLLRLVCRAEVVLPCADGPSGGVGSSASTPFGRRSAGSGRGPSRGALCRGWAFVSRTRRNSSSRSSCAAVCPQALSLCCRSVVEGQDCVTSALIIGRLV